MARTTRTSKKKPKLDALEGQPDPRAPLDPAALLAAARPLLVRLEADLRARADASPAVTRALRERHAEEKEGHRTAESFEAWRDALATQVAAAWLLSCVFVRTLEDRGLLRQPRLAGPGALDSQRLFFQLAPSLTERDYLLTVFRELSRHPAARDLFDAEHSLVWKLSPSADLAKELLALFRTPSAEAPAFRFGQPSTRFLGDLYQDLSEDVRKRYALLQTPDFIEAFILDRTLEPAIERFGLDDTTLIDPTCGSGHFLLGAFDCLFEHRLRAEPGVDRRVAAARALDAVYGADINPYAVAIARFRLTLSFLDKAGYARLADAPALPLHLVVADSLRINPQHPQAELWEVEGTSARAWLGERFALEDERAARDVLHRQYAAVVGNPPYITEKDPAKREVYRGMYQSAAGKYALSVPFCERFFQLARSRGYVGQITANSFMKREFGKRLVENYLPSVNLELIVNTSGAYIPGHGTPTVLLFGTQESASSSDVLAVLAKRGEPTTPADAAKGLVWTSIADHWDDVGFDNDFITTARVERASLAKHPWSLGGGGAGELKELIEERCERRLGDLVESIGFMAITGEDEVFARPRGAWQRSGAPLEWTHDFGIGEEVRDWAVSPSLEAFFPYAGGRLITPDRYPENARLLWPYRTILLNRPVFGGRRYRDVGRTWYEYHQVPLDRLRTATAIAFAFVATHNHFVLDLGGKVFKQSAPLIKLRSDATEDDHLALLAYLNSSTACFWLKQVLSPKGMHNGSEANATPFLVRFEFDGTKLRSLPVPPGLLASARQHYVRLGRMMHDLATRRAGVSMGEVLERSVSSDDVEIGFQRALAARQSTFYDQIRVQEEIDWLVYSDFELHPYKAGDGPLRLGERPFELRMATNDEAQRGDWFHWHNIERTHVAARAREVADPVTSDRVRAIRDELALLESPECKRRWLQPAGKAAQDLETDENVLREQVDRWIDDRIESFVKEMSASTTTSTRDLVARITGDSTLLAALCWHKRVSFEECAALIRDRLGASAVPFSAAARLNDSGMAKYRIWEGVWNAQRAEDRDGGSHSVDVPPKYEPADFLESGFFRWRGKLDVPKERFISYPGCESDEDGEPVYGWAGWDHLQRAQALASLYLKRKDGEGWGKERLTPMLAGLLELIPWVKQWHNEPSAEFEGLRMGDYFEQFLDGECRQLGLTHDDLRAWRPPSKTRRKPTGSRFKIVIDASGDGVAEPPKKKRGRRKKTQTADAVGDGVD